MATPIRPHIEQATPPQPTLFLAFELGQHTWKLGSLLLDSGVLCSKYCSRSTTPF